MLRFISLRKLSVSIAFVMVVTMLMPLLTYAAYTVGFVYNPTTGQLSGAVYSHDPNKVSIRVASPQGVMDVTYSEHGTVVTTTYDDNNVLLTIASFKFNLQPNQAPSQIMMNVCNQNTVLSQTTFSNSNILYYSPDSFKSGKYRVMGNQYFNETAAESYIPSGAKLVSFTPQSNQKNRVQVYLPYDNSVPGAVYSSQINAQQFTASDLSLTDITANETIAINSLITIGLKGFQFETPNDLTKDHTYLLKLSGISDGNEFLLPIAGVKQARVYLSSSLNSEENIAYFNPIQVGIATPGGSSSSDGGSPYGTMDGCSVSTFEPDQGTSIINPDSILTDNDRSGEDIVTKETDSNGNKVTKVVLDADKLGKALGQLKDKDKDEQRVTIELEGSDPISKVQVPAGALLESLEITPSAVITIKNESASYDLPIKLIDVTSLATQLGATPKDVVLTIQIEKMTGSKADQIGSKAIDHNIHLLTDLIDFSITAEANGKTQEVNHFGNVYVSRTIVVPLALDASQVSAVTFDEKTGKFMFVPAVFTTVNGETVVTMKRNSNSIYTIVQGKQTFNDLTSHWAKEDIEFLAAKQLVEGTAGNTFSPEQLISRAEFATLLTRALGLNEDNSSTPFKDVDTASWYHGSVGAAVKAGFIEGYEDGTFRPDAKITREQLAVMIAKALKFTGKSVDAANESQLALFQDKDAISPWARSSSAQVTSVNVINGVSAFSFAPQSEATRAQAVVMLKRLLQVVAFIN